MFSNPSSRHPCHHPCLMERSPWPRSGSWKGRSWGLSPDSQPGLKLRGRAGLCPLRKLPEPSSGLAGEFPTSQDQAGEGRLQASPRPRALSTKAAPGWAEHWLPWQRWTSPLGSRVGHIPCRALGPAFYFSPSQPPGSLVGQACCVCLCATGLRGWPWMQALCSPALEWEQGCEGRAPAEAPSTVPHGGQ